MKRGTQYCSYPGMRLLAFESKAKNIGRFSCISNRKSISMLYTYRRGNENPNDS